MRRARPDSAACADPESPCRAGGRRLRRAVAAVAALGLLATPAGAEPPDPTATDTLRIGIGDRLAVERGGRWIPTVELLDRLDVDVDLLQIWLPRGWQKDWIPRDELAKLRERGVVPVVVHYFFGDDISKERVEAQRGAWYASMWEMAQQLRGLGPVLVILEPEWNIAPPSGETAITDWPWFANDLRAAAMMIRKQAPDALVGTCPGDFPGRPDLEGVLGPVAGDLDFLAFQEMRATTDRDASRPGYADVGRATVDYARYLQRAFGRPLLVGYVAISSHGGWGSRQAGILRDLHARRSDLLAAGVFGLVYFQLYDDPHHEGYFGAAEKHFGLITRKGKPKPAFDVFRAMTADGPAPAASGAPRRRSSGR